MFSWKKRIQPSLISRYGAWTSKIVGPSMFQIGDNKPDTVVVTDIDTTAGQPSTVYDLIANVTHESVAGTTRDKANTVWKVHLRAAGGAGENEKWFLIQDLIVEETRKEMIFLGETILQVRPFGNSYMGAQCVMLSDLGKACS